jgi:hypothetical protein
MTVADRRRNRRVLAVGVSLATLASALAVEWHFASGRGNGEGPTLAELVAKNYRTLTPAESRRLVRYAEKEYRCLVAHGGNVSRPVASRTRITMHAPKRSADSLVQLLMSCDPDVGPPPGKATLQARNDLVLVYLAKRCLLSPTELPSRSSPQS